MISIRSIACLAFIVAFPGCTSYTRVSGAGTEINAKMVVCETEVKWQGRNIIIEGLQNTSGSSSTPRQFAVGRLDFSDKQIRELNNVTLLIDQMFKRFCINEQEALRLGREAWEKAIERNDRKLTEISGLLRNLEGAARIQDAEAAQAEQLKAINEIRPKL